VKCSRSIDLEFTASGAPPNGFTSGNYAEAEKGDDGAYVAEGFYLRAFTVKKDFRFLSRLCRYFPA
jgi:hypothetical protein